MSAELLERIAILERENAALVATLAERDARVLELERDIKAHIRLGARDVGIALDANDRARRMHRRAQRSESVAELAMTEGLRECERLRAVNKLATDAADVAMRLMAESQRNEEAAKQRVAVLTEALEAVEFDYTRPVPTCTNCSEYYITEEKLHAPGCIVGIALGRIPAEASNERPR